MSLQAQVRRRIRTAAEQLMESSSLRDNLVDEQAQQLLDWGLARLRETAVRTANLSDEDAAPIIEETATAVRQVMQFVNRLTGTVERDEDPELIREWTARLLKNLRPLTSQKIFRPELIRSVTRFNRARASRDSQAAFQHLMALIQHDEDNLAGKETI